MNHIHAVHGDFSNHTILFRESKQLGHQKKRNNLKYNKDIYLQIDTNKNTESERKW